jgi:hypothetical protein
VAVAILLAGAVAWSVLGLAAVSLGTLASEWLHSQMPPLVIDAPALGGGVTAMGVGLVVVGVTHGVVRAGLRRGYRWGLSAAVLLTGVMAVGLLALAAAGVTSAFALHASALALSGAGALAAVASAAYGWCAVSLVRRIGRGRDVTHPEGPPVG